MDHGNPGVTALFRLGHPQGKWIQSIRVNVQPWTNFDASKEWIKIPKTESRTYAIDVSY
jgi:hypothetical protein